MRGREWDRVTAIEHTFPTVAVNPNADVRHFMKDLLKALGEDRGHVA